jgi:hypothetical protein
MNDKLNDFLDRLNTKITVFILSNKHSENKNALSEDDMRIQLLKKIQKSIQNLKESNKHFKGEVKIKELK